MLEKFLCTASFPDHHIIKTKSPEGGNGCIENFHEPYENIIEVTWFTVALLYLSSRLVHWMRVLSMNNQWPEHYRDITINNIAFVHILCELLVSNTSYSS